MRRSKSSNDVQSSANWKDSLHKGGDGREVSSRRPWLSRFNSFKLFFLTCIVVAGVTSEDLMKCADIAEPMKQLHAEMGGSEPFVQSAVAADLVQIEQHLIAELPVSLRVQETPFSELSDVFRFNASDFLIVSANPIDQTFPKQSL